MSRSKFAVLNIDDDSGSEGTSEFQAPAKPAKKGGVVPQKKATGLVVHAVDRQRPKNKKNKEKVIDPTTGFVVQDLAPKESVKLVKHSGSQFSSSSSHDGTPEGFANPSNPPFENGECASHSASHDTDVDSVMASLLSVTKELHDLKTSDGQELEKTRERLNYYKERYKKLVELFRDTEFSEKAKLVADIYKMRKQSAEMTEELSRVTTELEQARTRIRQLEGKK